MRREIRESTVTLRHVQTVRRGDKVYRYLRVPGEPRIKLPDLPPDHPRFLAAYLKALPATAGIKPTPGAGTIVAMIDAFRRSEAFTTLSRDYRRVIDRNLNAIESDAEDARAADLKTAHIEVDIEPLAPHAAVARLKAWRVLCAFGKAKGFIARDVSKGIERKKTPKTDGHLPWEPQHLDAYRERWPIGTVQRAAFELLRWTAARIGDGVMIGPGMVGRDGVLAFRQSKTGEPAYVPWTCPLPPYAAHLAADREMMHAALSALGGQHMTFLATRGRTRSKEGLGNLISEAAREAGVPRSAHGLRKALAIDLAEGGATQHQGMAWTGHITEDEWGHYIRLANRRKAVRGEGNRTGTV